MMRSPLALLDDMLESPDWPDLSAYERTKRYCDVCVRMGEKVPSWTVIREIIGKGSASDINRAKADWRAEHAQAIAERERVGALPRGLTGPMEGLWREAVKAAEALFAEERADLEDAVAHARAEAETAKAQASLAETRALEFEQDAHEASIARDAVSAQLETERSARAQAERMAQAQVADLVAARDAVAAALERSQAETRDALTRLEGVEAHMLREIDRVRTESERRIAKAESESKRAQDDAILKVARAERQAMDLRAEIQDGHRQMAVLERECAVLRERADAQLAQIQMFTQALAAAEAARDAAQTQLDESRLAWEAERAALIQGNAEWREAIGLLKNSIAKSVIYNPDSS